MKRTAMIHSLKAEKEVEVVQYKDANHVIVKYDGQHCTAIDNPFSGLIYADDVYGRVDDTFRF